MSTRIPPIPDSDFGADGDLHRHGDLLWIPLRQRWSTVVGKPEELVRQEWVRRLVQEGGYSLGQMDQERRDLTHGTGSPRADIVVWGSAELKAQGAEALMVVETKAVDGPVILSDFRQGESYARAGGSEFLVAATASAHSTYQLTKGFPGRATQVNSWPTKADFADARKLEQLKSSLRVFDRDEFQKLLFDCHSLLRDHHAMTPDRAFDTISRVLFIKLDIERNGQWGTFTTDYLDKRKRYMRGSDAPLHQVLFDETKQSFKADNLFEDNDTLDISPATFRELVSKLQRFNLSKTSDDVKGIAFERFLGRTFRGELGQFFTPRPVVDFMVESLAPVEGELICDPAAGSGGFLIRVFEEVRAQIGAEIEAAKTAAFEKIAAEYKDDDPEEKLAERDRRIDEAFDALNEDLKPSGNDGKPVETRVGRLAWHCIYGTDKEPRAARTAKMNMVMHGDGHGGIHWHDGLVNINGIFDGRFDIVVTNPPFGASVTDTQLVGATTESDVPDDPAYVKRQSSKYGHDWREAHDAVVNARNQPILDLFEIGRGRKGRQTEILFVERCLNLLKPGGRLGIVLPNGNLNASSLDWLRRWVEGRAYLRGVVSLPQETFKFSKASVSASIVFLEKFTEEDTARWSDAWRSATTQLRDTYSKKREDLIAAHQDRIFTANGDEGLVQVLADLAAVDIKPTLGKPQTKPVDGLVEGAVVTKLGGMTWTGNPTDGAAALAGKTRYRELSLPLKATISAELTALRKQLRLVDDEEQRACWSLVRKSFDYPVFMATPQTVGITATGETGPHVPNDLPEVLDAWRKFQLSNESIREQ
ncbi:restriction endonuclease subunit M [Arthrobacter bambusae]|uniref:Type I restriction enzyme M protein n=1 Tax=Arthrobacter bambusae TaxID=1338426 RepID=A0AAW8DEM8_9MICC|nr:N-6 DNA methylase [Arthrobacter bambusae]MDP9903123.1 type I restriction enzyme M protein [Arthrobacter bambusae]MDQ0128883.1 type I restriction enzyme M protein [Arthrobacter bambusae]MDQ0180224.1 type I restriction enzyme M protein [Arthrobacter bambusae]